MWKNYHKLLRRLLLYGGIVLVFIAVVALHWLFRQNDDARIVSLGRVPSIFPDYSGVLIPPNIAPLNFKLNEPLERAEATISSQSGGKIELTSSDGVFQIPIGEWKDLLSKNHGRPLVINIQIKKDSLWKVFQPIVNYIAEDSIDPYLAYRLINPAYSLWTVMGLYQRNVETFVQKPIIINGLTEHGCMNCHSFRNNDPEMMMMHLRGGPASGTLIRRKDDIRKVNTATAFNKPGAYPSWHPNGNIIAYSANTLSMFFHAKGESRDVLDSGSDVVLYLIDRNMVTSNPAIADPDRMETFPCWSPDGKYLYFCAADKLEKYVGDRNGVEDLYWEKIRYDLMRIAYDGETNSWGKPETVLSNADVSGSITEPRISPDGKYLMFTKADYSNFPVYLQTADLYLLDLHTKQCKRLECNSDETDSFHSWSSIGRWFVFSSKRIDGLCARPFFSRINDDGTASKPVLLPQESPDFYSTFLKTFNVPELIKGPVQIDPRVWEEAAMGKDIYNAVLDPALQQLLPKNDEQKKESPDLYQKAHR